jgi:NAD(P)-dependent dehydrogenase (short-subunit alcohol dehydrogenase family)
MSAISPTQKTVIVTGGSQGIGAGLVKAFLDRGYKVVANSRKITKSGAFEESLNSRWLTEASPKLQRRSVRGIDQSPARALDCFACLRQPG